MDLEILVGFIWLKKSVCGRVGGGHSRQETNFDAEFHWWVVMVSLIIFKLLKDENDLHFSYN